MQPREIVPVETTDFAAWVESRLEQDLVAVDVPDPGEQALIHQRGLERAAPSSQQPLEPGRLDLERIRTQVPVRDKAVGIARHRDLAQAPLPDPGQPVAVGECDRQPGMARRAIGPFGVVEPAGHAKMQGKPRAAAQLDQQMLAVPPGRVELATLEPGAQAPGRHGLQHPRRADLDLLDLLVERRGVDVLPIHFDVREFGH